MYKEHSKANLPSVGVNEFEACCLKPKCWARHLLIKNNIQATYGSNFQVYKENLSDSQFPSGMFKAAPSRLTIVRYWAQEVPCYGNLKLDLYTLSLE